MDIQAKSETSRESIHLPWDVEGVRPFNHAVRCYEQIALDTTTDAGRIVMEFRKGGSVIYAFYNDSRVASDDTCSM